MTTNPIRILNLLFNLDLRLGDFELFLGLAKKYPESVLRKFLGEILEIPDDKIKTSRANIFKYLIKQYDEKTKDNSGN